MRNRLAGAMVAVSVFACGDGRGPAPHKPGDGSGATPGAPDAGGGGPAPLTEADCAVLVDHILAVGVAEQRLDRPEDRVATPEQVTQIRAGLIRDMTPSCLAYPRETWTCATGATTTAAIAACTAGP